MRERIRAVALFALATVPQIGCAPAGSPVGALAAPAAAGQRAADVQPEEPAGRDEQHPMDAEFDAADFAVRLTQAGGIGGVWSEVSVIDGRMRVLVDGPAREWALCDSEVKGLRGLVVGVDWERASSSQGVSIISDAIVFTIEVKLAGREPRVFVGERLEMPALRALRDEMLRLAQCGSEQP